ncbi:MAG: hypothetical protein IT416_00375 [Candidatus Pacebacteria bacterium]|nr:hypothetical protein [Candidatus Paceibacterota bacterium]
MQNKKLIIIGLALLVLVGGGFFFFKKDKTTEEPATTQKKKLSLPTNIIPVEERPYVAIKPLADGRNLEIEVYSLNKEADTLEYELEYQAGTLLQGAFGELALTDLPATAKILLGSCSAGGACTYHEDVQGGSLLTRYVGGSDPYALKSDWKYIDNQAKKTAFSSKDAKFQIDGKTLATQRYLVIFNTPGYPEKLPGTIVSEVYSLETSSPLSGQAELTIRANEEGELKIAAWNGKEWKTYEGKTDGKMITATVDLAQLYVVIK